MNSKKIAPVKRISAQSFGDGTIIEIF